MTTRRCPPLAAMFQSSALCYKFPCTSSSPFAMVLVVSRDAQHSLAEQRLYSYVCLPGLDFPLHPPPPPTHTSLCRSNIILFSRGSQHSGISSKVTPTSVLSVHSVPDPNPNHSLNYDLTLTKKSDLHHHILQQLLIYTFRVHEFVVFIFVLKTNNKNKE